MNTEFIKKVVAVQQELKAPKDKRNTFGNYNYRSCESILEAVKPILNKYGFMLFLRDEVVMVGDRYYIKAIATLTDGTETFETSALAREEDVQKGKDASQITGTASSYARKYALNGMFCIDDTKDADTDEFHNETENRKKGNSKQQKQPTQAEQQAQYAAFAAGVIEQIKKINTIEDLKAYKAQIAQYLGDAQIKDALLSRWGELNNAAA